MNKTPGPKEGASGRAGSDETEPDSTVSLRQGAGPAHDSDEVDVAKDPPPRTRSSVKRDSSIEPDPRIGQKFSKYQLSRLIGIGGMAQVYEAEDTILNRRVAVKFLTESRRQQTTAVERFINEAQVAGRLNHPNIIAIYDIGFENDTYYIAMELLNPGSAGSFIKQKGRMSWVEATQTIAQCCSALEAAHKAGIIHRDIKPDNILCSPAATAKLADFGLVKELHIDGDTGLTQSGVVVGTPLFMSPEQCTAQPLDARSDLYSLGCTFYALLTGSPPFPTGSVPQIMLQHCKSRVPDARVLSPEVPEAVVRVIEKSTAKRADDRYQNAAEMRVALLAILEEAPRATFEFLVPGTVSRPASRSRATGSSRLRGDSEPRTPDPQGSPGAAKLPDAGADAPQTQPGGSTISRRSLIGGIGLVLAAAGFAAWKFGRPEPKQKPVVIGNLPPLRVGVLNSQSGPLFDSGRPVIDATLLAIEEINSSGGVLGRQIEPVIADGKSKNEIFAKEAARLITEERVVTMFGGWSPSNRRALLKVIQKHKNLLMFPARDEGMEDSEFIIYVGSTPSQVVTPAVKYFAGLSSFKRLFMMGSDGLASNISIELVSDNLFDYPHLKMVGKKLVFLAEKEFKSAIDEIKATSADLIFNFMIGDSNPAFFRALRSAGIGPKQIPTVNFAISEPEFQQISDLEMVGEYVAASYFQSIDTPKNREFVANFKKKYGQHKPVGATMESAYTSVYLWAQAVTAAGTDNVARIRERLAGQTFDAPGGPTKIDPGNHHCYKRFYLGQIKQMKQDLEVNIIHSIHDPIRPEPFPPSRTRAEWEAAVEKLQKNWGGTDVNPGKPK